MKTKEPIAERFARDVATHQIDIRHDDGLYRHVVFRMPNTVIMSFSLTTTPGRLIYAGDMGCYVFERVPDMFSFFRKDKHEREPNFGYWHEKLVAIDRHGSMQNDVDKFRENLQEYVTDELTDEQKSEVTEFIESVVSTFDDEGPEVAYKEVYDFSLDEHPRNRRQFFQDFFELSDRVYTLHYEWACHAIQWGVEQYDAAKENSVCDT